MIYSAQARQEFLALEQTRRDVICVQKTYVDLAGGDLLAGIMLSQLVYWFGSKDDGSMRIRVWRDGIPWLAKRWEDWHEECRLSPAQARRCADVLVEFDLLVKEVRRFNGNPTVHLSLNWNTLMEKYSGLLGQQMEMLPAAGVLLQIAEPTAAERRSVTETTTETTTERESSDELSPRARAQGAVEGKGKWNPALVEEAQRWYAAYPRKTKREKAITTYIKLRKTRKTMPPLEELLARLERQKRTWTEPQYIPYPTSYLNDSRWEDEEALVETLPLPQRKPTLPPGCPEWAYFEYVPKATVDGSTYYTREEWEHPEKRPRGAPQHSFGPWPGPEEETRR